ncbi:MAG: response regulator [Bacteroidetes bacterium]|nr:MAG: response regulator [Bacteroidota bacterium]
MKKNITIIIAEDDEGHALLIKRNLKRAGVVNPILHFSNGEEVLEFFLGENSDYLKNNVTSYIVLLDLKMPKVDGIEVLEKLKSTPSTKKIPVIMITTTDNPREIDICHTLGCNSYIVKPIDYQKFIEIVKRLGYYLEIIEIPNPI